MLTKGAIEDLIARHVFPGKPGEAVPAAVKKVRELQPRVFLSDYEIRRKITPGARSISVLGNAIISPLSLDWLDYEGIVVNRS